MVRRRHRLLIPLLLSFTIGVALADPGNDIALEGGDTTVDVESAHAYEQPLANLSSSDALQQHDFGGEGFRKNFARSPIGGKIRIGPQFNNVSCVSCHMNAGRGAPVFSRSGSQAVVKISRSSGQSALPGGPVPVPNLGLQLRDHAIRGIKPDGSIRIRWQATDGSYPDGTPYQLRKPKIIVSGVGSTFTHTTLTSVRRPPPVFGVGLLDAIEGKTIQELADPSDVDHDGISGRPNRVWDLVKKRISLGKFGWKAAAPTVTQQIATAYAVDMGVSNPLIPVGDRSPDIDRHALLKTIFHSQTLAVPRARNQDSPDVIRGKALFSSLGCSKCHTMTLMTGKHAISQLSHQTIHPFSDLLLHDMGPELADNRPEFGASGSEWRTPPLWGIGLTRLALRGGGENYLHDGRARTLEEAILWHGGEAAATNERFQALQVEERARLISFLRSL